MSETLPLASIQEAVLEFLRGRNDAVVFGAQAVNAYVPEPRMSKISTCCRRVPQSWQRNFVLT